MLSFRPLCLLRRIQRGFFDFTGGTGEFRRRRAFLADGDDSAAVVAGKGEFCHLFDSSAQLFDGVFCLIQLLLDLVALERDKDAALFDIGQAVFRQLPQMGDRSGTGRVILFTIFRITAKLFRSCMDADSRDSQRIADRLQKSNPFV